jgi:gluconolactonase
MENAFFLLLFLPLIVGVVISAQEPHKSFIIKYSEKLSTVVPENASVEKLAGGLQYTEGPVWIKNGYLLFSDIPANTIYKWEPGKRLSEFLKPSGYYGKDKSDIGITPGSNGLALDKKGKLILCEHGNRRVTRLEKDGSRTVLADKVGRKRLNSPNDVVVKSDGCIYFTDPVHGLLYFGNVSIQELEFAGVYRWQDGELQLLSFEIEKPNGLAFSPDEKYLYVSNCAEDDMYWKRFTVREDGSIFNGEVFFRPIGEKEEGIPDGLKVDIEGNLYCTGPGGIWIISPEGECLGKISFPEVPSNCTWGGDDHKTLFVTARTGLYSIHLKIPGIG